jgi:GH24 family phage-related lysozyme (muramidase)
MIKDRIKQMEGYNPYEYKDTNGFLTIYYGHKIQKGEIFNHTQAQAEMILDIDIKIAHAEAKHLFPDINTFTQARQDALTELIFNMGEGKISRLFPRFVRNVNIKDWKFAVMELKYADGKSILSLWYQQVHPTRADYILKELEVG